MTFNHDDCSHAGASGRFLLDSDYCRYRVFKYWYQRLKYYINAHVENERCENESSSQRQREVQLASLWINYVFGVKVQGANQIWEYSLCMVIALEPNPES